MYLPFWTVIPVGLNALLRSARDHIMIYPHLFEMNTWVKLSDSGGELCACICGRMALLDSDPGLVQRMRWASPGEMFDFAYEWMTRRIAGTPFEDAFLALFVPTMWPREFVEFGDDGSAVPATAEKAVDRIEFFLQRGL